MPFLGYGMAKRVDTAFLVASWIFHESEHNSRSADGAGDDSWRNNAVAHSSGSLVAASTPTGVSGLQAEFLRH
jgi:hypothetical protein